MADSHNIEKLQDRIGRLVADRQALREQTAAEQTLERNRREIADSQHELSRALIARYVPHPA